MKPRKQSENKNVSITIKIKVITRASRDEISDILEDDTIKIKIKAPPVDGKANQALIIFLADTLNIKSSDITIKAGHSSRQKIIQVNGLDEKELFNRVNQEIMK